MRSILRERPLPGDALLGAVAHFVGRAGSSHCPDPLATSFPTACTIFELLNDTLDIAYNTLTSKNGLLCLLVQVVISCSSEVIARHSRSYGREELVFNPLHYLALLEQKSNALDQAAPLQGWQLPDEFLELRRQMEARLDKRGRREYVQVLRLLETFSIAEVAAGVRQALRFPAISFDAIKHLVLCALEQRPPRLDMDNYPHLPMPEVALTRAADYQVLLQETV